MNDRAPSSAHPTLSDLLSSFRGKTLAVAYDDPVPLESRAGIAFPSDATAEWETRATIDKIVAAWAFLGFEVIALPLDGAFLSRWAEVRSRIDLVHPLVEGWGSIAREGWIPALCELSGTPCIGSGPLAQCVAMRKSLMKILCRESGVPTARFAVARDIREIAALPEDLLETPHFLKPDCEGSGMGVDAVTSIGGTPRETRERAGWLLSRYPDGVLVEELLPGDEYTTALVGAPLVSLPVARVEVDDGVYGIANKSKEFMGEKVTFPALDPAERASLELWSASVARVVGMRDFVRLDWKRDARGLVTFLEANPLAGLSYYYSVLPLMAREAGLTYEHLLGVLAASALARADERALWYGRARIR